MEPLYCPFCGGYNTVEREEVDGESATTAHSPWGDHHMIAYACTKCCASFILC